MTPAKRRKLIRTVTVLAIIFVAGLGGRMLFFGESISYLLLGRRPGSADPGTELVRITSATSTNSMSAATLSKFEPPERPIRIKFDQLGGWKFIEGKTPIPDEVKKLDGKWVEITGFMYSNQTSSHLNQFIIVQSLWGCCFGKQPDMNHFVEVNMEPGKVAIFYPDPVRILGKLTVSEHRENGYLVSLYRLEACSIKVK